ncbi:energy transducer TonB [Roseomonas sp. KE2513]|uniref:energy transducer TonB n=1 Tax=Roseomonas sp. KE2513 TaxID=2479202 RepID=UPI0018DF6EC2|nr:energy transducer TonB [Roseomonas sp. KE2513]MBI0536095.1 energy transducer TonB [Roseomonas sp. KE2513]
MSAAAWTLCAAPAWRSRRRRERARAWPWWLAAALHAAALAALLHLGPETLAEPRIVEGTPLVWEGPVGAAEGAPDLSPDPLRAAPEAASPAMPAEAVAPPVSAEPPPPEAAATPSPEPAPRDPVPEAPALDAAPPAPAPAAPLPLPLPPAPPAPPAPPRAAPAAPAAAAPAPAARAGEVALAAGAIRLGAGTAGSPGESREVGAPQPGCQDLIGYPASERARGITGRVKLRLRVSDDGRVVEARVIEPSGSFALDEAARAGIRRCRFLPSLRDGMPVWGSRDYPVVFRLE